MEKIDLVPIIDYALEKAMRESGKPDAEIRDLQTKISDKILNDKEVDARIVELATLERNSLPALRAAVRPIVTLLLSCTLSSLSLSLSSWELRIGVKSLRHLWGCSGLLSGSGSVKELH